MSFTNVFRAHRLTSALALVLALLAGPVFAQGSSVLTGNVTDAASNQPVGDVVITATSPALQGEQVSVTDSTGLFRLPQLPSGIYTIRLEKEGYRPYTRGDIGIRLNQTVRVNVQLAPEALVSDEVVVVGRAPTIDVGSSSTGVNIGSEFIRNAPLVAPGGRNAGSRSFESLAEVAPGAYTDAYGISINGTTSPENAYVIDGLSVSDGAFGILATPLTIEFVQEVNVITGGYMPEYGRTTGGILNVVTKSGSNEWHGSVFGTFSPGVLSGPIKPIKSAGGSIETAQQLWNLGDFGVEVGGPILKDKLWVYAGFAPGFTRYHLDRYINKTTGVDADGNPTTERIDGATRGFFADQRSYQYIGKLTYNINQNHNVTLSAFGAPTSSGGANNFGIDPTTGKVWLDSDNNLQGDPRAIAVAFNASSTDLSLKTASSFLDKRLLLDVTLGWHHQNWGRSPTDGSKIGSNNGMAGISRTVFRRTAAHSIRDFEDNAALQAAGCEPAGTANATVCPVTTYNVGGPDYLDDLAVDRFQGRAVGTYLLNLLGHHVWKAGFDAESTTIDHTKAYSGRVRHRETTDGLLFQDHRQFGFLAGPDDAVIQDLQRAVSRSITIGGFLQDSWSVLDLVTLNAGIRYDIQNIIGADNQVALALPNQWSPRIGLVYDWTKQGKSKIYANYALFYENVPLDIADRSFPGERQITSFQDATVCNPLDPVLEEQTCQNNANRIPGADTGAVDPSQVWTATGGDKVPVDPDIKPQSSGEFVLGGEYEILADARIGASYTVRYMNSIIEDMSRDEATTYFIGNPGEGIAADFPRATRRYDAGTLYFNKTFSDLWMAQVSYTLSRLHGNWAGLFRPETEQLDPNINADFDLQSLLENRTGPLPGDRTHQFKAFAAKEFLIGSKMGLTLGGTYRARSGEPRSYLASHLLYGASESFILPRGSGPRLPWVHGFDARLALGYKFTKDTRLTFSIDAFNVFNFLQVTRTDQDWTLTEALPLAGGTTADLENGRIQKGDGSGGLTAADKNPNFGAPIEYQPERAFRFGVQLAF